MRFLWLLLLLPSISDAQWSAEQKVIGTTALAMTAIDFAQTRWIVKECAANHCHENNPILGRHPGIGRVNVYFASTALIGYVAAEMLPSQSRTAFLYAATGIELMVVGKNKSLGYGVRF